MTKRRARIDSAQGKVISLSHGNAEIAASSLPNHPSPLGPTTPPQDQELGEPAATLVLRRSRRLSGVVETVAPPELPRPTPQSRRKSERKRKACESLETRLSVRTTSPATPTIGTEDYPLNVDSPNGSAVYEDGLPEAGVSMTCENLTIGAKCVSGTATLADERGIEMRVEVGGVFATSDRNDSFVNGVLEVQLEGGEGSASSHRPSFDATRAESIFPEEPKQDEVNSEALHIAEVEVRPQNGYRRRGSRAEASRSRFLQIARDRAFHFAHFDADGDDAPAGAPPAPPVAGRQRGRRRRREVDNNRLQPQPQPQPQEVDWPGPFSTARQLVSNRAMAAAARQNADAPGVKVSVVDWKPTRVSSDLNFGRRRFPSLQDLCLKVLADNAENVVSLEGIPDLVRLRISAAFCGRRKMTAKTLSLFFQGNPSEVHAVDCTQVCEDELVQMMKLLCPGHLEKLHLEHCGRALSEQCLLMSIAGPSMSTPLKAISFRGAYRLSDRGLEALLQASPQLVHLDLSNCYFLTNASVEALSRCVGGTLESLVLDGCSNLNASVFVHDLLQLTKLRKLSVAEVGGITDEVVREVCTQLGSNLSELVLACCSLLSDASAATIGSYCPALERLNIANIPALTDIAIAHITDNLRSLQGLYVKRCKFSDEAIATFVTASGGSLVNLSLNSVQKVAGQTVMALARHSNTCLECLDLSFCRLVDNECLGFLADSCSQLRELRLFGCTQVTDVFLNGHSNSNLNVIGLSCSQ